MALDLLQVTMFQYFEVVVLVFVARVQFGLIFGGFHVRLALTFVLEPVRKFALRFFERFLQLRLYI